MDKVLTVAICAFNMEKYLEDALKSCIIEDLEKMEVLIMDDGSTDRTGEIADRYASMYPGVFYHVKKENGGWGTNVNMAINQATGRYFKLLDADDWFNVDAMHKLITILEDYDVDLVLSDHTNCLDNHEIRVPLANGAWKAHEERLIPYEALRGFSFTIWNATFNTSLMRQHYIELPSKTLYTDTLLVLHFIPFVENVYILSDSVYNYRLGREGQSASETAIHKHIKELLLVFDQALRYWTLEKECKNKDHLRAHILATYNTVIERLILLAKYSDVDSKGNIKILERRMKNTAPDVYDEMKENKKVRFLRLTGYTGVKLVRRIKLRKEASCQRLIAKM